MDDQLIRLLGQDARQSSVSLARQLNVSPATVRRRLRKLIRDELLHIIGVVDPDKFGLPVAVVITLDVDQDKLDSALEALVNLPEIRWVSTTAGRFDIIAMARFPSTSCLSVFLGTLRRVEGVRKTETYICLDVKKRVYVPIT